MSRSLRGALTSPPEVRLQMAAGLLWAFICLVLLGMSIVATASSVGRPIPGVVVTNNLIAGYEPSEGRATSGIRWEDVIVEIQGKPTSSRQDLERSLALARGAVPATVRRGAATVQLDIQPRPLGLRDLQDLHLEILLVGLIFLVLGTACLLARPGDPGARALFWFCSTTAAYQAARVVLYLGNIPGLVPIVLLAALGSAALQMGLVFPAPPRGVKGRWWIAPALYFPPALVVALGIYSGQPWGHIRSGQDAMWHDLLVSVASYWTLTAGLSALAVLGIRSVRSQSERTREHARIALLGAGVAFGPTIGFSLLPAMLAVQPGPVLNTLSVLFAPFFPAAVAYAVLRKELFEVEWAVRRTATYALVSAILTLAYYAVTIVLQRALHWEAASNVVATIVLVVAFAPVRDRLQAVVDGVFHRVPYDFREVATEFARSSREITEIPALLERFKATVEESIRPVWIEVRVPAGATTRLGDHPAMVLDLRSGTDVYGSVAVGTKLSGQDYAREDRDLLDLLGQNVALGIRNIQLIRQVAGQERLRREIEIAAEVQAGMMPRSLPEIRGVDASVMYRPALEVAGDFFDLVPLPEGRWGAVIGDVSGKGVPAALLAGVCLTLFRALAPEAGGAVETMNRVNNQLRRYRPLSTMFVCAAYVEFDPGTGAVEMVNAGLPLPWRGGTQLEVKGRPLGFSERTAFTSVTFRLEPDETLLCYTDGLEDARTPEGRSLGPDGVSRIVTATAGVDAIRVALEAHLGSAALFDDVTVLVLRREQS